MKTFFIIVIFFVLVVFAEDVSATTYYISPTGTDPAGCAAGTSANPWKTFAKANSCVAAGDTLVVKDGTYSEAVVWTKSGAPGNLITIKAQNDGKAIVDTQGIAQPLLIQGQNYITLEGIVFQNSNNDVIEIRDSSNITLRRVSAYNEANGTNCCRTFHFAGNSTHNLVEDASFTTDSEGNGFVLFGSGVNHNTIRRIFCIQKAGSTDSCFSPYHTDDNIFENIVINRESAVTDNEFIDDQGDRERNRYYGIVARNMEDGMWWERCKKSVCKSNVYKDIVLLGYSRTGDTNAAFRVSNNESVDIDKMTIIGIRQSGNVTAVRWVVGDEESSFSGTMPSNIKNSHFEGTAYGMVFEDKVSGSPNISNLEHDYNNYWNVNQNFLTASGSDSAISANNNERCATNCSRTAINPAWPTATYGDGAYLMVPAALKNKEEGGEDIGADVIYRYINGVKTATPLWPWPMEDRICQEIGVSVTWENNTTTGCSGGLWKTLAGVYETSDTTPPAPPTGLGVR